MTDMRIGIFASDLGAVRKKAPILLFDDIRRFKGFGKTGPPCTGIIFIQLTEKRFTGDDIDINTLPLVFVVFVLERRLRTVFLRHLVLHGRQFLL